MKASEQALTANIFDVRRFSTHDGDGIRTTVFFKGCPLACVWCHNPEGISAARRTLHFANRCIGCGACAQLAEAGGMRRENGIMRHNAAANENWDRLIDACPAGALRWDSEQLSVTALLERVLRDQPFFHHGGGVTLSGGEALLQADAAAALLAGLKERGVNTALETSLYVPQVALDKVLPYLDCIYADLKLADPARHKALTGGDNHPILANLRYLLRSPARTRVTVRTPMIPGMTATRENVRAIGEILTALDPKTRYELLNYNPLAGAKYPLIGKAFCFKENPEKFSPEAMAAFAATAREAGLTNVLIDR